MRLSSSLFLMCLAGCEECGDNSGNTTSVTINVSVPLPNPVPPNAAPVTDASKEVPAEIKLVPVPVPYSVTRAEKCP